MDRIRLRRRAAWTLGALYLLGIAMLAPSANAAILVLPATDPPGGSLHQISPGADIRTNGGGQVLLSGTFGPTASFGFHARRPAGFSPSVGEAIGRLNYNKHAPVAGRHVNVPITFMAGEFNAGTNTGNALLVGDCTTAECPSGVTYVLAEVADNGEPGTSDSFRIHYCTSAVPVAAPVDTAACAPAAIEGGTIQRGNIQVKGN